MRLSSMFAAGVSFGTTMVQPIPARAAYAAQAPAALPADGRHTCRTPSSCARVTASASPRALNDPVGIIASSLTQTGPVPNFRSSDVKRSIGVIRSPRETMDEGDLRGSIGKYFQNESPPEATSSRRRPERADAMSYEAKSALPQVLQTASSSEPLC